MIKTTQPSPSMFSSLDDLLNQRHPLYKLSHKIHWSMLEQAFTSLYSLGNGRPAKPIRLMCGLLILKHLRNTFSKRIGEKGIICSATGLILGASSSQRIRWAHDPEEPGTSTTADRKEYQAISRRQRIS